MSEKTFEDIINDVRGKLDETSGAKVSDDLVAALGIYRGQVAELEDRQNTINTLKADKDELLKVNGKLFQRIGFEKKPENDPGLPDENEEEKIDINTLIDSKGNIIK